MDAAVRSGVARSESSPAARAVPAPDPALRRGRPAPPLRLVLALGFGTLGFCATVALALLIGREATRRIEAEIGGQLAEIAGQMARGLDQGMFERWSDIRIAADSESLRDPAAGPAAKRAVMERLARTYPAYAIIGLVAPDGRIAVTSSGVLEGADVAGRDYFLGAREKPYVGDVHAAQLLQRHVAPGAREPLRLIDLAAPVTAPDGRFLGVLAAHLDWAWARDMARALEASLTGRRAGAEILILAGDGTVLLGPPALQGAPLPPSALVGGRALDPQGASRLAPWPDSRPDGAVDYLSATAGTAGFRDYPGLGWRVVVRQTADRALDSVAGLRRDILAAGAAVALGAALLAWVLAGLVARPLRELAVAAGALGRGEPLPPPPRSPVREGEMIAGALGRAADELARREESHRLLVDELNHRVKNTLATVQSIAAQSLKGLGGGAEAGREAFEARLLALSRAHDTLTRESWAGADLRGIADQAVRPFLGDGSGEGSPRIALDGPDLRLPPEVALALTMILHELCTNAVKHGALSVPGGWAALGWTREAAPGGGHTLRLAWRESGGPPVAPPSRRGFGTRLLERGLAGRGTATLAYGPEGLVYTAAAPLPAPAPTSSTVPSAVPPPVDPARAGPVASPITPGPTRASPSGTRPTRRQASSGGIVPR